MRRLRVQDWYVRVKVQRAFEMREKDCWGYVDMYDLKRQATIYLLHPLDYDNDCFDEGEADPERTIIHELVHLKTHPLRRATTDDVREVADEQLVHDLSIALLDLERERDGSDARVKEEDP